MTPRDFSGRLTVKIFKTLNDRQEERGKRKEERGKRKEERGKRKEERGKRLTKLLN